MLPQDIDKQNILQNDSLLLVLVDENIMEDGV